MLIGWEAYNYFINCTIVQFIIFSKTNKMAESKMVESHLTKKIAPQEHLKQKD